VDSGGEDAAVAGATVAGAALKVDSSGFDEQPATSIGMSSQAPIFLWAGNPFLPAGKLRTSSALTGVQFIWIANG
jgi:hypothetical protein